MTTPHATPIRPNVGVGVAYPWTLAQDSDGTPAEEFNHADRCVQISGTLGGATVSIQGSNDGAGWFTLHDPFAQSLSFTSLGAGGCVGAAVAENPRYVRPLVTGGDGTTAVLVILFGRRNP
jgi:hypothetical protein